MTPGVVLITQNDAFSNKNQLWGTHPKGWQLKEMHTHCHGPPRTIPGSWGWKPLLLVPADGWETWPMHTVECYSGCRKRDTDTRHGLRQPRGRDANG